MKKSLEIKFGVIDIYIIEVETFHKQFLSIFDEVRKEGNVLFNDTLNTFYLWLYGVGHKVK